MDDNAPLSSRMSKILLRTPPLGADAALPGGRGVLSRFREPAALTVGLCAASLLGQTERSSLCRELIDHEDRNVRDATAAFLGTELEQSETILRNRLANESDPTVQSTIVRALLPSGNGDTIAAIERIYNENERARSQIERDHDK